MEWHTYYRGYRLSAGHRATSATTQDYRSPGHFDWQNGASDERAEKIRLKSINECMDAVPNHPRRWRTALEVHAKNLHCGAAVWQSAVLPKDRAELEVLMLEARNRFAQELKRKELL
jgi:hypothetical protein